MPHRLRAHRRTATPLLLSALSLASVSALAQDAVTERTPYYLGLSQSFSRDSNVYRTPTNEVAETISSTGVLAGFDQPIGRQRFYGDASAQVNRYRNVDALNNKSYAVSAGLDWETVDFLSGVLRYSTRDSLADFGTLNDGLATPTTAASDQTTQQFLASLRYGLTSKLGLDSSYEHRRLKYKSAAYTNRNYSQDAVSAGVHWGTTGILVFGVAVRATKGVTEATPTQDELKRRDVDFTTVWTPTGFSILSTRISSTKETHSLSTSGDVSALTGSLSWNYRPTAKLNFTTSLTRDTGTETTFITPAGAGSTPLQVDNNRLSTSAALDARYALTSKISLTGEARHRKGTLPTGEDDATTRYGLGFSYLPTRSITVGCDLARDKRDASVTTTYTATTTSCSAQITLK